MPPKRKLGKSKEKSVKGNETRGSGSQSRIKLNFEKLRTAGWTITEEERQSSSGVKVYFRYSDPQGKTVKSAKDVERQLKDEGTLETFLLQGNETKEKSPQDPRAGHSLDSEDSDYEPPAKKIQKESEEKW